MNIKTKIALDRVLGTVVAYPLNLLVRLMGKITRFDHSLKKEMNKIVVCKFKGMGSIVQTTPLLQTLRKRYPNAHIVFVSSEENRGILERIPLIDEIYIVRDNGLFNLLTTSCKVIFKLIRFRADVYIDLEIYSNYSSIITTVSLARDRFGYYLRSNRYRMGMYTHMMYFNAKAPIAEAYLQFARLLGIEDIHTDLLSIPEATQHRIPELSNAYLVINPNASDLRYERRWPAEHFTALMHRIRETHPDVQIYLIGSKSESAYVSEISRHFSTDEKVVDLSGKTSLNQLIELLRNARLLITNDTGPMHLASSIDTTVLALFGPCSPMQYGLGKNVKPIYKNLYCSPCVHEFVVPPCKGNNQCMKLISVDEVFDAYLTTQTPDIERTIAFVGQENLALGTVNR